MDSGVRRIVEDGQETIGASAGWRGRRVAVLLGIILLVGLAYRLQGITIESIWWDEYTSVIHLDPPEAWKASPDFSRWAQAEQYEPSPSLFTFWMRNRTMDPATMPLYYTLEYMWHTYVDESMWSLRLLSILIGLSIIPALYLLGRDMFGPTAGLIAALCLALSPIHRQFAQEIRMYGLMTLLAVLSVYTFFHVLRQDGKRWWGLHAACNFLLLWTHPFALLIPFVEGVFWLFFYPRQYRRVMLWVGLHGLLIIPSIIYIATIQFWSPNSTSSWMKIPTALEFAGDLVADDCIGLTYQLRAEPDAWQAVLSPSAAKAMVAARMVVGRWMVIGFLGVAGWLLVSSVWRRRFPNSSQLSPDWRWVCFAVLWWLLPPLVLYGVSHVWRPCIMPRYTLHSSIGLYLLLGGGIATFPWRILRVPTVVALVGVYVYQASLILPGPQHTDWKGAADFVRGQARSDDVILVHNELWKRVFLYSFGPSGNVVGYGTKFDGLAELNAFLVKQSRPSSTAPGETCRVWTVVQTDYFESAPIPAFENELKRRGIVFDCKEFGGIQRVLVYYNFRYDAGLQGAPVSRAELSEFVLQDYCALALEYWRIREFESAIAICNRVIELDPTYATAYSYLGMSYKEMGESDKAQTAFARALELRPYDYPWNWVNLGILRTQKGQYDEAIDALNKALELLPNDSWTHTCLGKAYLEKKEIDTAISHFRKAVSLDPADPRPSVELEEVLKQQRGAEGGAGSEAVKTPESREP